MLLGLRPAVLASPVFPEADSPFQSHPCRLAGRVTAGGTERGFVVFAGQYSTLEDRLLSRTIREVREFEDSSLETL